MLLYIQSSSWRPCSFNSNPAVMEMLGHKGDPHRRIGSSDASTGGNNQRQRVPNSNTIYLFPLKFTLVKLSAQNNTFSWLYFREIFNKYQCKDSTPKDSDWSQIFLGNLAIAKCIQSKATGQTTSHCLFDPHLRLHAMCLPKIERQVHFAA